MNKNICTKCGHGHHVRISSDCSDGVKTVSCDLHGEDYIYISEPKIQDSNCKFNMIEDAWNELQDDYAEASIAMHVGNRKPTMNDTAQAISDTAERKFLKAVSDIMMNRGEKSTPAETPK